MSAGKKFGIVNPQPVACNYYWLPGVTIPGKGRIILDYDPRERAAGVHRTQLMHDVNAGLVKIEQQPSPDIAATIPPDGPADAFLRDQTVHRADSADVPKPETVNLNEKLGWKPIQTVVESEMKEENLEDARAKTIGANAMNTNTDYPFGMPPELVKAQNIAKREAEHKAIADAAVAKAREEDALKAADTAATKPKRGRRRKASGTADQ